VILPSKKVLSVFVLTAALVAAIIIAFSRDKASSAINYTSDLVAGEKVSIPENPNWQNELSGVSQNTAPVQISENTPVESTLTDTVSLSLMSNYLALKQNENLDATSAQNLVDKTLEYIEQTKTDSPAIQVSGLNVVSDNGKQSIIDYGENFGMILKTNKPKQPKEALDIVTQAVQSNDPSKIKELDSVIAVYNKVVDELVKMPVPKTFVKAHLDIINGLRGGVAALIEIKTVFNDPFKALVAIQLYQNGVDVFTQAMQAIYGFMAQNNIIYKQGSGGYYLLYGI